MRDDTRASAQIGLIVVGILIAVLCVFAVMLVAKRDSFHASPAELHDAWAREATVEALRLVGQPPPTPEMMRHAKENLLALRVAPSDRDTHLALVMAVLALERNEPGAREKLRDVLTQIQH